MIAYTGCWTNDTYWPRCRRFMADLSKLVENLQLSNRMPIPLESFNAQAVAFGELTAKIEREAKEKRENIVALNHLGEVSKASLASEFCERLEHEIRLFDGELDQDHEVGMKLVTYGQAITIHVTGLGYYNPSLIMFFGATEDRDRVQLIQHVSQISFLLVALPKLNPNEPKRAFGFEQGVPPTENANSQAG